MNERKVRSLAKGFSWRVLATLDTVLLALIFTGSARAALSIGAIELFTKVAWYYGHERLWVFIGKLNGDSIMKRLLGTDPRVRSVAKAISWRFVGALDTTAISLVITGNAGTSASIGGTELITKTAIYYFHEQLWHHIPWGIVKKEEEKTANTAFTDAIIVLRYYYHLSAAVLYFFVAILFVFMSAGIVYLLHATL